MVSTDFKQTLWKAADKLRAQMDAAEYKHIVLGLIFLKYISDTFAKQQDKVREMVSDPSSDYFISEDPSEFAGELEERDYYTQDNVFWVPQEARWESLRAKAKQPDIGSLIDGAMTAIENENASLRGKLDKRFGRAQLGQGVLGELIDLISTIGFADKSGASDVLGEVYEYFLGQFASAEGKKGGQFYTPSHIVKTLVAVLSPHHGRIYDPCCGSGGMFVQSEEFVKSHGGRVDDISIYGQESNPTTWRLAAMNLAIRGFAADLGKEPADTFARDQFPDLKFDYIMANPPFNISDWGGEKYEHDPRWKFGRPPVGNANYAWLQHILWKLRPGGSAGVVLGKGSMGSTSGGELQIRKEMIDQDVVEVMISLPAQLFLNTQSAVCLWFMTNDKSKNGRDRRGETLFIDGRKLGEMKTATLKVLTDDDIDKLRNVVSEWKTNNKFQDIPGFCKSVKSAEVRENQYDLMPEHYVEYPQTIYCGSENLTNELLDNLKSIDTKIRNNRDELVFPFEFISKSISFSLGKEYCSSMIEAISTPSCSEQLFRILFRSWFVNFDPLKNPLLAAKNVLPEEIGNLLPNEFQESELGEIPLGWSVRSLDEIGTFRNGLALQKYPAVEGKKTYPIIKIAQLRKGYADGGDGLASEVPDEFVIDDGDFIFSWSGSLLAKYWVGGKGALNQHLFKVTGKKYPLWFVSGWVYEHLPKFILIAESKATTMGHIKRTHLSQAKCCIPPIEFINIADRYLRPLIDQQILEERKKLLILRIHESLTPRIIAGEQVAVEIEQN